MTTQPQRIDDALNHAKAFIIDAHAETLAQNRRLQDAERVLEAVRAELATQDKRSGGVVIGVRDNNRTEQLLKDILKRLDTLVEAHQDTPTEDEQVSA